MLVGWQAEIWCHLETLYMMITSDIVFWQDKRITSYLHLRLHEQNSVSLPKSLMENYMIIVDLYCLFTRSLSPLFFVLFYLKVYYHEHKSFTILRILLFFESIFSDITSLHIVFIPIWKKRTLISYLFVTLCLFLLIIEDSSLVKHNLWIGSVKV